MDGSFLSHWACRASILLLIVGCVLLGLSHSFFSSPRGGQVAQRPQQPALPGSLPSGPGQLPTLEPTISPNTSPNISMGPPLSRRQKDALVKDNFKKTKDDVTKLSKLVRSLQQQISKSNANILSLSIVKQANRIEKLAKRIRNEAKEY